MLQKIQFTQNTKANTTRATMPQKQRVSFTAIERTLLGLKPDAYEKGLTAEIVQKILERTGLKFVAAKIGVQSKEIMKAHYSLLKEKPFFENDLIPYVTRGKFGAFVLEGENAVEKLRQVAMDLRKEYGVFGESENLIHSSDAVLSGTEEVGRFFPNLLDIAA